MLPTNAEGEPGDQGAESQPAGPNKFYIPISTDSAAQFQLFLRALKSEDVHTDLSSRAGTLPVGVQQLLKLNKDANAKAMAQELTELSTSATQPSGDPTRAAAIAKAQEIGTYLKQNYPEGLKLLEDYGRKMQAGFHVMDTPVINTNFAVNTQMDINVFVHANVGVASMAIVAAFVVAVAGIVIE